MTSEMDHDITPRVQLRPLVGRVDCDAWSDFLEESKRYKITQPIRIHLPGWNLQRVDGDKWDTGGTCIDVDAGYDWDGCSMVLTTAVNRLPSLVHDVICTKVNGVYPVASYTARHTLYYRLNRVQGEGRLRAGAHWTGLMLFNWLYAATR